MTIRDIREALDSGSVTPEMVDFLLLWVRQLGDIAEYMGPRNGWLLPDGAEAIISEYVRIKEE